MNDRVVKLSVLAPIWLFFFFILPLFYVLILSFLSKGTYGGIEWSLSFRAFEKTLNLQYAEILLRTAFMAFVTASFCTILGALCAWYIVSTRPKFQNYILLFFILPFLLNSLIRLYALQNFVGVSGPLQGFIRFFQEGYSSLMWTHNTLIMYVGLILTYLPFAILPLTAAFEKWEPQYLEAAQDLGAGFMQSFFQVVLPLLRPSLATAFIIVFIPCLGEYLVPEILGGSQKLYWGQLIAEAYFKWRDWPVGSVFGLVLIFIILILFSIQLKKQVRI